MGVRIAGRMDIPDWVRDHESFRRWARSPACPETARIAFYDGDLWVDPEMEQLYVHNQVKHQVSLTLGPLVEDRGLYIPEGMLLSNPKAKLSTVPDGYFVSDAALDSGRAREVAGTEEGYVEIEGTPEMVLEVVSKSSETKDLIDLKEQYWRAGIDEYWIIDARGEEVRFELLRHGSKGYISTRKQSGGWLKSEVFGRSFRIVRGQNRRGRPSYKLEIKKDD